MINKQMIEVFNNYFYRSSKCKIFTGISDASKIQWIWAKVVHKIWWWKALIAKLKMNFDNAMNTVSYFRYISKY